MGKIQEVLSILSQYRAFFVAALDIVIAIAVVVLLVEVIRKAISAYKEAHQDENKLTLRNVDYSEVEPENHSAIIRKVIAPDDVDPSANGYFVLVDAGRELYIRSFTISATPKKTHFNKTFASLFDFPSCTSSVFIEPIAEKEMSRKLDHQIDVLEQEMYTSSGQSNRVRKLRGQRDETEIWAEKVESGDEKFFNVGFLFSLYAPSIEVLNNMSDDFRNKAIARGLEISSCFAVQAEAYLSNMPMNRKIGINSKVINSDAIKMHQMDRLSLSTVFNYTSSTYSHKDGIPLGRDMFSKKPFVFDVYDPGHDGFLIVIAGKTGSGKSASIKIMCERYALQGYRFVCIDSQKRKGTSEGEYAALAEILDGVNFQISNKAQNILNIFEIHESLTYVKEDLTSGHEIRTLELADKILLATNDIRTMMQEKAMVDDALNIYIDRVVIDCITEMYRDFGIRDREPDSLYEMGQSVIGGQLTSGLIPKKLPTITDFYKKLLVSARDNTDPDLAKAYKLVIMGIKDYVKELYYSEKTVRFFTKEQFDMLPSSESRASGKCYVNEFDDIEEVIEIHGVRPYFDGQSTLTVSKNCTFTNIDISQLPDQERNIAREIAINFVNEQFIKKNSESINSADKLLAIFDEAHENFAFEYARKTLANSARTARKMNVGLIFSTQTIEEFSRYDETKDILRQAAVKMVCKQDYQDKEYLMKTLHLTDSQAELICNSIGSPDDADAETKRAHRGEMCIIDTNKVVFVKVDMIRRTEALSVETTASEIKRLYHAS